MDRSRLGDLGARPEGQILRDHRQRPSPPARRDEQEFAAFVAAVSPLLLPA